MKYPETATPPQQTRKRIRICHVVATDEGGTWMFEQLRELRDRYGFDVTAIVSSYKGGLIDKLRTAAIPFFIWNFEFKFGSDLFSLVPRIFDLARLFREQRFDVVQTHLFQSMVIGRIAAWLADVPVRLTMVAGPFHLEAYTPRWIDNSTCWMDMTLIGSCACILDLYRGLGVKDSRLALIYYGPDERKFEPHRIAPADLRREFGWAGDTPLIGSVAYFYGVLPASRWIPPAMHGRAVKGHEYLIKAMPRILSEFPNARLVLAGAGWREAGRKRLDEMKALANHLGLQDKIVFAGFRSDVSHILRALDVSVQSSLTESVGGTAESLLMECPTVATRVGGMVDSVIDGKTGILVRPADADDLAEGILKLLRDREYACRLGRAGRQWMLERFTLSRTVTDLKTLYDRLLWPQGRRAAGHRRWISLWRTVLAMPIFAYLAARFVVADKLLLVAWDAGWRPFLLSSWRILWERLAGLWHEPELIRTTGESTTIGLPLSGIRTLLRWIIININHT